MTRTTTRRVRGTALALVFALGCADDDDQRRDLRSEVQDAAAELTVAPDTETPDEITPEITPEDTATTEHDATPDGDDDMHTTPDTEHDADTLADTEHDADTLADTEHDSAQPGEIGDAIPDAAPTPVDCDDPALATWTRSDYVSSGMWDSYFFEVVPGSTFCATITGTPLYVGNGITTGVYCDDAYECNVTVREEDTIIIVTAFTESHEGSRYPYYTLTVKYVGTALH